ncbi:hypothetical protein FXF51_01925 [Nonomuraea sp. PA05]|uniref:DUF7167 family protein n=1 Tax=Nonomuraea sp. PA05 TaxID=2604466 RepID=UPI0011D70B05|nr:hypothetical protein [Nonomuraea sp. PA05]TYB71219.1 hypothetical protein FXF51_01925 [Nonomuraea sp. PA05]
MSDTVKFRVWSEIRDIRNSYDEEITDSEISVADWAAMTQAERDELGERIYQEYVENRVGGAAQPVEPTGGGA